MQLQQTTTKEQATEWQKTIARTIEKIRQSLDLEIIFRTTTEELRQLLNVDRVAIYRFNPDWSGEFVFESITDGWVALMQEQLQHPELGDNISECQLKELVEPPTDTYLQDTGGGRFAKGEVYRICHNIYECGFSNCYIKVLESYQAKSYVIVAILYNKKLWGLLAVYQNSYIRHWQENEVYLLTQVGSQLGVALQQAEYLQTLKKQAAEISKAAERQRALVNTVDKIRQSLDIDTIFKTTTQEVRNLLEVERVAIYRFYADWSGEFVADSILDGSPNVNTSEIVNKFVLLQDNQNGKYARNEVFVPISQGDNLWGLLVAYQNSQPRYWQDEEINLLAQVGVQLGVALQQAESLKQVQIQAEKLAKAAEREKTLAATVEKIRQSLDLNTIFATSTEEIRRLLEVEGVTIYRFCDDFSCEFVAESLIDGCCSIKNTIPVITDDYLQRTQGGDFANGKVVVVNDIYQSISESHNLQLIEKNNAKAYLIVPIFQGERLWGLLTTYQRSMQRIWQEDEVDLLVQISSQLGVGIQQAELLAQTKRQKEEITQTFKELQQTQSKLIQSEKMAGLGQLVAGLAHEINNPISFIYGNIPYVNNHIDDLLNLVSLYQKIYPQASEEISQQVAEIDLDFIADDLPKMLISMRNGADRIRQLVLSLRTFSRLDEAEMKPVNLHEGIESSLLILQHRLQRENDSFVIEVVKDYGELPLVFCYAAQMNQVFMNILNNAIDALEYSEREKKLIASPKIWIRTALQENRYLTISIADNGCGIPENLSDRIFEPFFTTKQPGQGTGLGLSVSYQIIVQNHQGNLKYISQVGKGCEFLIEIPVTGVIPVDK